MSCKLFVGGLSWSTSVDDLIATFSRFGDVLHANIVEDPAGRSRGFGFVTFENSRHARTARMELDGSMLGRQEIRVYEAHDNKAQSRRRGRKRR